MRRAEAERGLGWRLEGGLARRQLMVGLWLLIASNVGTNFSAERSSLTQPRVPQAAKSDQSCGILGAARKDARSRHVRIFRKLVRLLFVAVQQDSRRRSKFLRGKGRHGAGGAMLVDRDGKGGELW